MKSEWPPVQSPHNLDPCAVRDCFLQHTLSLNTFQHGHESRYGKHTAVQIYMTALNSKRMKQKQKIIKGGQKVISVHFKYTKNRFTETRTQTDYI